MHKGASCIPCHSDHASQPESVNNMNWAKQRARAFGNRILAQFALGSRREEINRLGMLVSLPAFSRSGRRRGSVHRVGSFRELKCCDSVYAVSNRR